MTRIGKIWTGVAIVVVLAIAFVVFTNCYVGQRIVQAAEPDVDIGTALTGERRVTELEPISPKYGRRLIEVTTYETSRTAARVYERSRTETTGDCIYNSGTGENLICLYQEVFWKWRYNTDLHRASWVDVDWSKRVWRDNAVANFWEFKSWDGTTTKHGEYPSAGENLQWKSRQVWASVQNCILTVGCWKTTQLTIGQHIRNYDDGHFHSFR